VQSRAVGATFDCILGHCVDAVSNLPAERIMPVGEMVDAALAALDSENW